MKEHFWENIILKIVRHHGNSVKSRIVCKWECGKVDQICRRRRRNENIGTIDRESENIIWITKIAVVIVERRHWEKKNKTGKRVEEKRIWWEIGRRRIEKKKKRKKKGRKKKESERNKNKGGKESRNKMEITENMGKKKWSEQRESNKREAISSNKF